MRFKVASSGNEARERGSLSTPSLFALCFSVFCFPLLAFNALPSDQVFLAPLFLLLVLWLLSDQFIAIFFNRGRWPELVIFCFWIIYLGFSTIVFSYWPWLSLWMGASLLLLPLCYFYISSKDIGDGLFFLNITIAIVLVNSLFVIFLSLQGLPRPAGLVSDSNLTANFSAIAFIISMSMFHKSKKIAYLILMFIFSVTIFVTLSRGALIALFVSLLFYFVVLKVKGFKVRGHFCLTIGIISTAYFFSLLIISQDVSLESLSVASRPDSLGARFLLWQAAWDMIVEFPVFGTGLGSFALRYPSIRTSEISTTGFFAHNDYMQLFLELGAAGFIFWAAFPVFVFLKICRIIFKSKDFDKCSMMAMTLSVAMLISIHSLVNFIVYHPLINVFLGILFGFSLHDFSLDNKNALSDYRIRYFFIFRVFAFFVFCFLAVSFVFDQYSRAVIDDVRESNTLFNLQSDSYYQLIMAEQFSPLNIGIKDYIVSAESNTAIALSGSDVGEELRKSILRSIEKDSWLKWGNCSQQVSNARLVWFDDKLKALEILKRVLAKSPGCIPARVSLAEAHIEMEDLDSAISILNAGIDRFVYRENSGAGPLVLVELLIHVYELAGRESDALALKAYLDALKARSSETKQFQWSRTFDL